LLDSAVQSPDPVQILTKNITLDSGWQVKFHENHIFLSYIFLINHQV
jgi:hypothetical protein